MSRSTPFRPQIQKYSVHVVLKPVANDEERGNAKLDLGVSPKTTVTATTTPRRGGNVMRRLCGGGERISVFEILNAHNWQFKRHKQYVLEHIKRVRHELHNGTYPFPYADMARTRAYTRLASQGGYPLFRS